MAGGGGACDDVQVADHGDAARVDSVLADAGPQAWACLGARIARLARYVRICG
jgi:hypothetical protein